MVHHVTEDVINQVLKNSWGISKAKRHHLIVEGTKGVVKSPIPLVTLTNADKIVGITKVQFDEDPRTTQWLEGWINQMKRVFILHREEEMRRA